MIMIQNEKLRDLIKDQYSLEELHRLFAFLKDKGTFDFPALHNGLFPAASATSPYEYSGYQNVWVRDNVYIAYAHYINDHMQPALSAMCTLAEYFKKHKLRFENIINAKADANQPMNRPHVRFNGEDLEELDQRWAHAQNDALGYFLWLFCKLCNVKALDPSSSIMELLALFPLYFEAIGYWQDEDSGHWEETRKIEASSIGVVSAGLKELQQLLAAHPAAEFCRYRNTLVTADWVGQVMEKGFSALDKILPNECIQPGPLKQRSHDAALLFLIFPAEIVNTETADTIVANVIHHLQGDYGIRRYLGDSFWAPDYKQKLPPKARTEDFSEDQGKRDRLLQAGQEAQWCLFDPIISIIFGQKYQQHDAEVFLQQQIQYFNRSLGQLTASDSPYGELKCPELYYLEQGKRVPNDSTPLLWTQANLWMAWHFMEKSLAASKLK